MSSVEPKQVQPASTSHSARLAASSTDAPERFEQYRAPQQDGTALVAPSIDRLAALIQESSFSTQSAQVEFCDLSLPDAREEARKEAVHLAKNYCSAYTRAFESVRPDADQPIILAGHQPELFHPGVWFKNFLLSSLSRATNAISINFAVDNDLCRSTSLRIPVRGEGKSVSQVAIPFDSARTPIPWEMRSRSSAEIWNAFPDEVAKSLPSARESILPELWAKATTAIEQNGNIGSAFSQARHLIEVGSGVQNLEVPLSHLVGTRTFARFSIQLLSELQRFQSVYNAKCEEYRNAHKIRNRAHPVPNLEESEGWLEAPLWVYRKAAPERRRLWVRKTAAGIVLSDRAGWQDVIEGKVDCQGASAQWLDIQSDGVYLRPRALLTTMYLRLMVADLFVHGIGGGKYDQLTDRIIEGFFGIEPPPLAVATATLQLPLENSDSHTGLGQLEAELQKAKAEKWRFRHNPKSTDQNSAQFAELLEKRNGLLTAMPPKGERWRWHHEMQKVNESIRKIQSVQVQALDEQIKSLNLRIRDSKILSSREYSFCLFEKQHITNSLRKLAEANL